MTPVRLEHAAHRSRVKHSTTEPLRSRYLNDILNINNIYFDNMVSQMIKNCAFYSAVDVYQLLDCMFSFYNPAVRRQDPRGLYICCACTDIS